MNGQEKQRTVKLIMFLVPGKKKTQNITNLIFMLVNKCFRLDLVTQNPLIANEVVLKPVTYFLMADIKILIS